MFQQQVYIITTILMLVDGLCVIAAGYGAYFIKANESYGTWSMDTNVFSVSVLLVMFVNNYAMGKMRLYADRWPQTYYELWLAILKAVLASFAVLAVGIFLYQQKDYSRLFLVVFALLSFVLIAVCRTLVRLYFEKVAKKGFNILEILLVGNRERGEFVTDLLNSQMSWGHEILGRLAIAAEEEEDKGCTRLGCIDDLPDVLRRYPVDEVVFAVDGDRSINLMQHLDTCRKMGVSVRILPSLWREGDRSISIEKCQDVPFLTLRSSNFNATGLLYKRILDFFGGLAGTVLLLMMYPFIAVAIKLDSPGPVIFKQKRMGQNGRVFNLYKFRSMYVDAEERRRELMAANVMNGAMFKLKDDPRITRMGRWLRKTSLDEFPQFLNVLRGEMSLVGTRPPMIEEVEKYRPEHLKRISAKPGITGLWQVSGRNKITDFEHVVQLDCSYLENWRFLNDLKILAKTVWVVLQRKGAI